MLLVTPEQMGEILYKWCASRYSDRKHMKRLAKDIGWPHRVGFLGADAPTRRLIVEVLLVRIPITMHVINSVIADSPLAVQQTIDAFVSQLRTRKLQRMQDVFDDFAATYTSRLNGYLNVLDDPMAMSLAFLLNLEHPPVGPAQQIAVVAEFAAYRAATVVLVQNYSVTPTS